MDRERRGWRRRGGEESGCAGGVKAEEKPLVKLEVKKEECSGEGGKGVPMDTSSAPSSSSSSSANVKTEMKVEVKKEPKEEEESPEAANKKKSECRQWML